MNNDNNNYETIDFERIFNQFKTSNSPKKSNGNGVGGFFKKTSYLIIGIIIALFLLGNGLKIYFEITELNEIGGFETVYYTNLTYMILTAMVCSLLSFFSILLINLFTKSGIKKIMKKESIIDLDGKATKRIPSLSIALITAFITIIFTQNLFYKNIMIFLNSIDIGVQTPITNLDVGYYLFQRPLLKGINEYFTTFTFFLGLYSTAYYAFCYNKIFKQSPGPVFKTPQFLRHISVIGALWLTFISFTFKFQYDGLVYGNFLDVSGIGYVADHVWKNFYLIMPYVLIAIVIFSIIFVWQKKYKVAAVIVAIFPTLFVLVGLYSSFVQNFSVKPNEASYEQPYLKNNIAMTRKALALDKIKVHDFNQEKVLTPQTLKRNEETVSNIRVVDYESTLRSNIQLQSNTHFYTFVDGDIVNYEINGKETPVFISAREITKKNIPGENSYVNRVFKFTHGYGLVVNPINKITNQGQVEFYLGGLKMDNKGIESLNVTEPRIYYGELTDDNVIVNPPSANKEKEVDYDGSTTTSYDGNGGIRLNLLNRILYAIKSGDLNILISENIGNESKLLLNRQILERTRRALPFLEFDSDPYIIIDDEGRLKWIVDGYTTSYRYPYASYFNGINYIRNSVKIVIDAYDGNLKAYAIDKEDPILQVWMKAYPGVILDEALPDSVIKHMKYPEDLFKIQTEGLRKYHLDPSKEVNVDAFYQKQDFWDIARYADPLSKGKNEEKPEYIEPYYNMIKLPGGFGEKEELILMRPFTPTSSTSKRHNMVAWLAARNNADNYGELVLFKFPKNTNVFGPDQVEVNINQIDEVAERKALWSKGDTDAFNGNLLVIPIEETVLYVLPIFIKSKTESSIPQVRAVVVGYQKGNDFIHGFGTNLEEAVNDLFANEKGDEKSKVQTPVDKSEGTDNREEEFKEKLKELQKKFDREIQQLIDEFE